MPAPEPREITESFRLNRVLRSSRSGIVFHATDPRNGEIVAIKLIPASDPASLAECQARFLALAAALSGLGPPGFPRLRDAGFTPDASAFLVMDYVDGVRLDTVAGLTATRLGPVLVRAADALAALASKGLWHGNVSPDNLLLDATDRAWLVGTGTMAYRPAAAPASSVLDTGAVRFAAPERLAIGGPAATDWRGDLYSFALTACSLLKAELEPAGSPTPAVRLPFEAAAVMRDPNALRSALELSLRQRPEERPASFAVLRDALKVALGDPGAQAPVGERVTFLQARKGEPGAPARVAAAPVTAPLPRVTPAPSAPPAAPVAPVGGSPAAPGHEDWEEPENAPAWLVDAPLHSAGERPSPRLATPSPAAAHDDKEDTNPVPVPRRAELPATPRAAASQPAPTVGAPAPLPTPTVGAPTPLPTPVLVAAAGAGPVLAPPIARVQPLPPAPAAASAPPVAAAPVPPALEPPRAVDATPPTGSYELPPAAPAPAAEAGVAAAAASPATAPATDAAPPPVEAPPAARPGEKAAKPAAAARKPKPSRLWLPLTAAAVAVAAVAATYFGFVLLRPRPVEPPAPTPAPARSRPTPVPKPGVPQAVLDALLAAEEAVANGDGAAALAAIDGITREDELTMGPGELGRLARVRSDANDVRRNATLKELQGGLAAGNLRTVREALRRVTSADEAAFADDHDAGQTLEEARRVVNLLALATKAQQTGNHAEGLQNASALLAIVPRSAQAAELREKSAAALESQADALIRQGQIEQAAERLETLARHWPNRPGLASSNERLRAARATDDRLASLLAQAEQAERDRRPDRGLELLRSVAAPPYLADRFREARARLEAQLAELDASPPVPELAGGVKLEYSKNKPFTVTVRVSDDFAVKGTSLFLRVKGAQGFKELVMTRGAGSEWSGEITSGLHENKAVEFYVVASDYSGHTGSLGTADQPLVLKKKWSLFGR